MAETSENLLFLFHLNDALDVVVTLIDDQRHSFHHHHGCVEAQSLWLVNAYLAKAHANRMR